MSTGQPIVVQIRHLRLHLPVQLLIQVHLLVRAARRALELGLSAAQGEAAGRRTAVTLDQHHQCRRAVPLHRL